MGLAQKVWGRGKTAVAGTKNKMEIFGKKIEAGVKSTKTAATETKNKMEKIGQKIEAGVKSSKAAATETKNKMAKRIIDKKDDISNEYNYEFKPQKVDYLKKKRQKIAVSALDAAINFPQNAINAPKKINNKARQVKDMFQEKMPLLFEQAANKIRKQPLPQVEIIITCDEKDDQPITINRSTNFKKLVLKDCTINHADIAEYLKTNKTLEELDLTDNKSDYKYYGYVEIIMSLLSNTTLTSLKISLATEIYPVELKRIIQYVAGANSKRIKPKKYLDV